MTTLSQYFFEMPAVQGIQAGRPFYLVNVPMATLKRLIAFDTGNVLDRSQRDVNPTRAKKISNYMAENSDTYILPSLIGVIDRHPTFVTSEVSDHIGILKIDMDSEIKLFDGQHRATGIIDRVNQDSEYRHHNIPVMLFTDMTLEERQQAFSDINGHTVKPSTSISDTYNCRNDLPKLVVDMARNLECFQDFVDFERNVIAKNSTYLFPIKILKDATARLLGVKVNATLTDEQRELAKAFWTACDRPLLWKSFRSWTGLNADDFREQYISSHGVFLNALGMFGNRLYTQYGNFDRIGSLSSINIKRDSEDFQGRCICPVTGNMKTDVTAIKLTAIKLMLAVGCPVDPELQSVERLYFPKTEFPKAVEPEPEVIEPAPEAYKCHHVLADMVRESLPDLTEEQIDELTEKLEACAIETGVTVEDPTFRAETGILLRSWNGKWRQTMSAIRAGFAKVRKAA
ncbi:DNA sulfur modification protein DndB [Photobacterium sp. GSS17]|uniref:DNA sulfur modification protein DndB n=1 Tax=Photobacterium sp. GSS17 TaxID=3020715 RepID=UPI00235F2445|nr:DNA sulfur modification protein DndB [Photobacterium sp. GSS17]